MAPEPSSDRPGGVKQAAGGVVHDAFAVEKREINLALAIAAAIVAILPLAIGVALDDPVSGLVCSFGSLNTALAIPPGTAAARVGWGLVAIVGGTIAAMLGVLVADTPVMSAILAALWTGTTALLRVGGKPGALIGFVLAATFILLDDMPVVPSEVLERGVQYLGGGLLAFVVVLAVRHFAPSSVHGTPPSLAAGRAAIRRIVSSARTDRLLHRHVLRLAVAIGIVVAIYKALDLEHGAWAAFAVISVLQPSERATWVRVVQRCAGTLVGASIVVVVTLLTASEWPLIFAGVFAATLMFGLMERSYYWVVVGLTTTALCMISALDFQTWEIVITRVVMTAAGIAIGVAVGEVVWRLPRRRLSTESEPGPMAGEAGGA